MSDLSEYISDSIAENYWTPDLPYIESKDHWYVFIYGKRRGKSSAYFTNPSSEAEFTGIAWTKSNIYSILNIVDGKSENTIANPHGTDRILGEVWKIPSDRMLALDSDEYNNYKTQRLLVPCIVGGIHEINAWIYITDAQYLAKGGITVSKVTSCTYINNQRFIEVH